MGLDYSISIPKDINNKEDKDDEDRGMGRTQGMVVMNVVVVDMWTHQLTRAASYLCLLYTSPSPRDQRGTRMPSSA